MISKFTKEEKELMHQMMCGFLILKRDLAVFNRDARYNHVANAVGEIFNNAEHYQIQIHLVSDKKEWFNDEAVVYIKNETVEINHLK